MHSKCIRNAFVKNNKAWTSKKFWREHLSTKQSLPDEIKQFNSSTNSLLLISSIQLTIEYFHKNQVSIFVIPPPGNEIRWKDAENSFCTLMNNSKILTGQSYSTLFSTLIHVRPNMRHKIQTEIVASHTSKSTESPLQPKNIFQITTFL